MAENVVIDKGSNQTLAQCQTAANTVTNKTAELITLTTSAELLAAAAVSGAPPAIASLAKLQATYPTGDTKNYVCVGNVAEIDTLNVTGAPISSGNLTITLDGTAKTVAVTAGTAEVASLTITAGCTTAGNDTITLNGVDTNVALTTAMNTAALVATAIRSSAFTGYITGGSDATITFTANTVGAKTDASYSAGTTGATGTMSTTTQGVDGDTIVTTATKIRSTAFTGWSITGTDTSAFYTATATGARTAPIFSAGTTGVIAAITVTEPGADGDGHWYYWSGSAWIPGGIYQSEGITERSITPSQTTFADESEEYALSFTDENNRCVMAVTDNGNLKVSGRQANTNDILPSTYDNSGTLAAQEKIINDYVYAIADSQGKTALAVKSDGTIVMTKTKSLIPGNFNTEIAHYICYGQSWSVGWDTNGILSTQSRFDNLMFAGGVCPQYSSVSEPLGSFVGLHEQTYTTDGYQETPVSAQCEIVKELLETENNLTTNNVTYQLLGSAPGEGSKQLEMLAKGTIYYTRLIAQVQAAYNVAQSLGKTYNVPAVSWVQGYATDDANYVTILEQLRIDLDTDIKAITGQTNTVKLITWQLFPGSSWHDTAATCYSRYVQSAETYEHIICSGPSYFLDQRATDNIHLTAESTKWLGAYLGLAYKRTIIDGVKFQPLKPIGFTRQGKILLVKFNVPKPPLTWDITRVTENTNYGFNLYASDGITEKTISSVSIVAPDTVKIVASTDILATDILTYCNKGTTTDYGRTTGKRGNLRDSQGDTIIYDGGGLNLPLHNWCVAFYKTIG